jgi:hypothetical protein
MGIARAILKKIAKGAAKKNKAALLGKKMYKYKNPIMGSSLGLANVPFIDTPDSLDQENFNNFYQRLQDEGLVRDEEGLNGGVIDPENLLKHWNQNSYHNKNKKSSWVQTALTEGSAFIPFAGLPISMGLGAAFENNAEGEDERLYQDIRRKAYMHMGKEMPDKFIPEE